jgi:UDP-N-acetylmuramoyl-L-alanyl-D-glutamate--2,6-diaminopimelate ligase
MTDGGRVRAMPLSHLLADLPRVGNASDCKVKGLCTDSRRVGAGDIFFALSTDIQQRQTHINAAIAAGAVAILADADQPLTGAIEQQTPVAYIDDLRSRCGIIASRFYGNPAAELRIIGITGTNGKTSVCHYLAQLLSGSDLAPAGVIGTLGCGHIGALTPLDMTTPGAVELQGILADLTESSCRSVVMEVSSHALDQGRVADLGFEMAVLTNLSRDHLDYHGDMAAYADAKQRLFRSQDLRKAVVNFDDPFGREIFQQLAGSVGTVGYGLDEAMTAQADAFVSASDIACTAQGLTLRISGSYGSAHVATALLGKFNVYNLLAASAAALALDVPFAELIQRLGRLQPVRGRFERFGGTADQPLVVVDFAHTPDGLTQALASLRELSNGQLWCVFGCGGDRDRGKRPLMGAVAARWADQVILTSDNPRSEDPDCIITEIHAGIESTGRVRVVPDRAAAIRAAITAAGPGDVVLIAGKGHETYQEIQGRRYPFSDQAVVRASLDGCGP